MGAESKGAYLLEELLLMMLQLTHVEVVMIESVELMAQSGTAQLGQLRARRNSKLKTHQPDFQTNRSAPAKSSPLDRELWSACCFP